MDQLEKIVNRLKKLRKNQGKSLEEIYHLAELELSQKEHYQHIEVELDDMNIEEMFSDINEKKEARKLLRKYVNSFSVDTISEKNTLKQLVFLEIFNFRLQNELNTYQASQQPSPVKTVEALHNNLNQISDLKDKLGLNKKLEDTKNEGYDILNTLFSKWRKWREENSGSRTLLCPWCQKMILLKIRRNLQEEMILIIPTSLR